MKIAIDFERDGLKAIFRDWEIEIVNHVIEVRKTTSNDAHSYLSDGYAMSRASVMNFLNDLEDLNIVTTNIETCRGGYRKVYTLIDKIRKKGDIVCLIGDMINEKLLGICIDLRFEGKLMGCEHW